MSALILLVVLLLPLVWSACVAGVRRMLQRDGDIPDDSVEKRLLLALLFPVGLGLVLVVMSRLMPLHLPQLAFAVGHASDAAHTAAATTAPAGPARAFRDGFAWLCPAALAVYAIGLAIRSSALVMAFVRLRRIVALAKPAVIAGETVCLTQVDVPPLVWGRNTIVLPESLVAAFDEGDVRLIVQHERAHLHRGDSHYFAMLSWIDAVLWFNPFARLQTRRCRIAAELACDAAVTRQAPSTRQTYARVLIRTLKHTAGNVLAYAPAVFSPNDFGDYRMRIREIMHGAAPVRKPKRQKLYVLLALLAAPVAFAQLAWSQTTWRSPAAPDGPAMASSAGVVSQVYPEPAPGNSQAEIYAVQVDNGGGVVTNYGIAGKTSLKVGDKVAVGQLIAAHARGPESTFIPVAKLIDIQDLDAIACMKTQSCRLRGDLIHGYAGAENQHIAIGHAELHLPGRTVLADAIFTDPKGQSALAQGHIRIIAD